MKKLTDLFRPLTMTRHHGLQQLEEAGRALHSGKVPEFKPLGSLAIGPAPQPRLLLDFYVQDPRALQEDMLARPDHYDDRQKEIITSLVDGTPLARPATDDEKNEIVMQYVRDTELARQSRDSVQRVTNARHEDEDDQETIMEDGRSLKEHKQDGTARRGDQSFIFEKQNGDKIII